MFSPLEAFLTLSYTGMLYVLSCRGFSLWLSYTGMVYVLPCRCFLDVIVNSDVIVHVCVCSLL